MQVTLRHHTSLEVCSEAIRTCWDSHDKSDGGGEKDRELIERVGNKYRHSSTLEHLYYSFYIDGISRACLQELARHRMASLSVKSTRYTLKELRKEEMIDNECAKKYIVLTGNQKVDLVNIAMIRNLKKFLDDGIGNDIAKYAVPESYKTALTWSINARSLQNFLALRSAKPALWEIRELATRVYGALPSDHRYLFTESMVEV